MNRRELLLASVATLLASPVIRLNQINETALGLAKWSKAGPNILLDPDTWYHLFTISERPPQLALDRLPMLTMDNLHEFALSRDPRGEDLPGHVRRVGSILTDDAGDVVPFRQFGETFRFDEPQPPPTADRPRPRTTTIGWHDRRRGH